MNRSKNPSVGSSIAEMDGSLMSVRANSQNTAMRYKSAQGNRSASLRQQGTIAEKKDSQIRWRIGKLDARYECKHCETYLKYPVQFQDCRHRVCSTCLTDILKESAQCPTCQKPIKRENISIDHEFQKEIHNIPVFCNNRNAGCNWEGNFKEHFVSWLWRGGETCG